jgi:hypothetical protein
LRKVYLTPSKEILETFLKEKAPGNYFYGLDLMVGSDTCVVINKTNKFHSDIDITSVYDFIETDYIYSVDGTVINLTCLGVENLKGLTYVASPLKPLENSSFENNLNFAKRMSKKVADLGAIPFTPHLYFSTFLDDFKQSERDLGIKLGMETLPLCNSLVYSGYSSSGMLKELTYCIKEGYKIYLSNETPFGLLQGGCIYGCEVKTG